MGLELQKSWEILRIPLKTGQVISSLSFFKGILQYDANISLS